MQFIVPSHVRAVAQAHVRGNRVKVQLEYMLLYAYVSRELERRKMGVENTL